LLLYVPLNLLKELSEANSCLHYYVTLASCCFLVLTISTISPLLLAKKGDVVNRLDNCEVAVWWAEKYYRISFPFERIFEK
jgi:hypothetical protein